jgi:S1-C subfamily serine protease
MNRYQRVLLILVAGVMLLHAGGCATTRIDQETLNLNGFTKDSFVNNYFKNKKLSKVEGIWRWLNGNYTIAVIKNNTGTLPEYEYLGVVIKGRMVKPGVVKLKINKTASSNVYSGVYVTFNLALPGPGMDVETTFLMTGENIIETAVPQIGKVAMIRTYPPYDEKKERVRGGSGSGFFINDNGYVVTNNHVIDKCKSINVVHNKKENKAVVYSSDYSNDIAVLKIAEKNKSFVKIKVNDDELGQSIIVLGFPLSDLLADNMHMTSGDVSALSGIKNDQRYLQMSAPVQSGNSGGPLLDESGNLSGIVTSKLNAIAVANYTGTLPENVNFAIKSKYLIDHLKANNVNYETSTSLKEIKKSVIAKSAKNFTVKVKCNN